MPRPQAPPVTIARWRTGEWRDDRDQVAAEEPLQLSLDGRPLSIVMRTPGNDLELALGLLWAERVIRSLDDVVRVRISAEAQEREAAVPLRGALLAVSGRAGYEVVQKAVAAGIPILAAVGAPSSLAVATAERFGMTLVGFLRDDRFNVYTSPERIGH